MEKPEFYFANAGKEPKKLIGHNRAEIHFDRRVYRDKTPARNAWLIKVGPNSLFKIFNLA
jgi:hypothetical protein